MKTSIIILTKDKVDYLQRCIDSLEKMNDLSDCEVIIISNNSEQPETYQYLAHLKARSNYRTVEMNIPFNYSKLNNEAAKLARGEYLLFLNNDIEFIEPNTIAHFLQTVQGEDVGILGATLLYPDYSIQHAGVNIHSAGAWQPYRNATLDEVPHLKESREVTAVIGACLLIEKSVFNEVQGFNEELKVVLNDVDLCLKVRNLKKSVICSKQKLLHHEGVSRGKNNVPEDVQRFKKIWKLVLDSGDCHDDSLQHSLAQIEDVFREKCIIQRPIYIFGSGDKGEKTLKLLEKYQITGFLDNNKMLIGTKKRDIRIEHPSEILNSYPKPYIIIASMHFKEIQVQLENNNYLYKTDYYRVF